MVAFYLASPTSLVIVSTCWTGFSWLQCTHLCWDWLVTIFKFNVPVPSINKDQDHGPLCVCCVYPHPLFKAKSNPCPAPTGSLLIVCRPPPHCMQTNSLLEKTPQELLNFFILHIFSLFLQIPSFRCCHAGLFWNLSFVTGETPKTDYTVLH